MRRPSASSAGGRDIPAGARASARRLVRKGREAGCHRSRRKSSNGCRCGFMTFLPACRSMTCGPSICRGLRSGITLDEFLRAAGARPFTLSPVVRGLLTIRFFVGRLLGWDREPDAAVRETFASRLTAADLSKSLAPAGTREGLFRIVYRFENEQLLELINRTAHAAALSALVETATCLPLLFRCLRAQRRPLDARVHGPHRPIPQVDRLSVAPAQRPHELEPHLRQSLTCSRGSPVP